MGAPKVVIAGSGLAGLTAALELQKRGFEVTVVERNGEESLGGKLGMHPCAQCGGVHEHTHHIFLNWYYNFWRLAEELGLDIDALFEPRETVKYLRSVKEMPGANSLDARMSEITDEGSIRHFLKNLSDGPESAANMFLYGYSLLDLITKPYRRKDILDNYSVNGFMRSRWYATPEAAQLHQRYLNVAFANPSFQTSGETYKKFIAYSACDPVPQFYLAKQGVRARMIAEARRRLAEGDAAKGWRPARILTGQTVTRLVLSDPATGSGARRVDHIVLTRSGTAGAPHNQTRLDIGAEAALILAVSLDGLHQLVDEELYEATDNLERVHSLGSATISALELAYSGRIEGIPREHTALVNSTHQLSFLDGSQIESPDPRDAPPNTRLTVSISAFDALDAWDETAPIHGTDWGRVHRIRGGTVPPGGSGTNWDRVKDMIFAELKEYLPDLARPEKPGSMCLVRNTSARLFLNDVHDWSWQPEASCREIDNLFLAGEFVRNPIDAVTVESAVVTGLQAAEAARARASRGEEIVILLPKSYPANLARGATAMLAPYAFWAKAWASYDEALEHPGRVVQEGLALWMRASRAFWTGR